MDRDDLIIFFLMLAVPLGAWFIVWLLVQARLLLG